MCNVVRPACLIAAVVAIVAVPAGAQTPAPVQNTGTLRVFLDCDRCDTDFLRTEITFIDYMRDRRDADVHLLITTQDTGGGGTEWTLKFIGLGRFAGMEDTLKHLSAATDTSDERRRGVAQAIKLGLMRYVAGTSLSRDIKISFTPPTVKTAPKTKDRWNYWVFQMNFGGSFNGEESTKSKSVRGSLSANRTTNNWRINLNTNGNYRDSSFDLGDGTTFTSVTRNLNSNATVVKSLTSKWSLGFLGRTETSTFVNYDLAIRLAPGVEYDFFPYSESTRRMFTVQYTVGYNSYNYKEETIFSKLTERIPDQRVDVSLTLRQPWGSVGAVFSAQQYLNARHNNRLQAFGEANVRLFKGFSINGFGEIFRPRDQFFLPKGAATNEEILVRQRQLATNYGYFFNFGISYRFGSIFNNIVNPRFGGGGFFD